VRVGCIKIHRTILEGYLEGDAVDRDVLVFLPRVPHGFEQARFCSLRLIWRDVSFISAFSLATFDVVETSLRDVTKRFVTFKNLSDIHGGSTRGLLSDHLDNSETDLLALLIESN
jgi:hypothetical protein